MQMARRTFDCDRGTPRAARHFVVQVLRDWNRDVEVEAAALLVSELVTNAVLHGHCHESTLTVAELGDETVRVMVTDPAAVEPRVRTGRNAEPGGHGMRIVDLVAQRWGCERCGDGKTVWFDLRAPSRGDRAA
jgi:anti-sigma regulatory factor (Ser/Thr protein kinase)